MKTSELQQKSDKELNELLRESRAKSVELRFNVVGGNVKDVRDLRQTRKTIAKAQTILRQRQDVEETK